MIKLLSLAIPGLLLALAAPWATALEMGDLVTRSHLGQPYAGEIRIKGELHTHISPDCVRLVKPLQPDNLPSLPPGISIEYRSGQQGGVLRLIGKQMVLDPALQLSVFIGCGVNLQRDYVVMLDLPGPADQGSAPTQAPLPQTALLTPPAARTALPNRPAAGINKARPAIRSQPPAQLAAAKPHAAAPQEAPAETTTPIAPPTDTSPPSVETPSSPAAPAPLPAATSTDNEPLITIGLITLIALLLIGIWYQHRRNILAAAREDYSHEGHPITRNTFHTQPPPEKMAVPAVPPRAASPQAQPAQAKATEDDEMPALPATAASEYMMDLTDVMLSFGETKRALSALHDFVHEHPDDAVDPWLRLLELLRIHGKRPEFDALASKLHLVFNIAPPTWEETDKSSSEPDADAVTQVSSLEDFTHIRQRLVDTWGTAEGLDYLDVLVRDNRAGQRRGFPLEIVEETIVLRDVLALRLNKT